MRTSSLVSLILCRYSPTSVNRLSTICEFNVDNCFEVEDGPGSSSQLSFEHAPTLDKILTLVHRNADFGCSNFSRIELDQHTIHYFISLDNDSSEDVYLNGQSILTNVVFVCVSKSSAANLDVALFLKNVQRSLASDREVIEAIVLSDATGNNSQLFPKIQPKLRQLMMMATEKYNHQSDNYNNEGASGGITVLSMDSGFNSNTNTTTPQQSSTAKITDLKRHVEEVKTVMSDNMIRILERGERLENLDHRTEALHASSQNFKTTARRVQRNMCLKNLKWTIVLIVFITVLGVLIVYTVLNELGIFTGNH